METKNKEFYEAPYSEVVGVYFENIVCSSELDIPSGYPEGGDPFVI